MFIIGTKFGIVRDHQLVNNKYHVLKFTPDIREAKTWLTWQDAHDFLYSKGAVNALDHRASYAVILPYGTTAFITQAGEVAKELIASVLPVLDIVPVAA